MKTDAQLKIDVTEQLQWEPSVNTDDVRVAASNGVVTLTGTVPSYAEKRAAEHAARRVKGVRAIAEELDVHVAKLHNSADADIAHAVVSVLAWHVWVPPTVQATVQDGWVTLTGTVTWGFERESAADCVRFLSGVKGVSNLITLKPGVEPSRVKEAIEKALSRDAELEAAGIKVEVDAGSVTLTGRIRSWSARDEAGLAAWSAPGVTAVTNELALTY